ncbi:MAG TPA: DUF58 domain-containing protein [Hungateiclostridium thermocellum]|jgi:uncharacterized protein (DUF58 family)|uniref:DUF58 domain-containing protein n=2 Tax=Acetivibrio thermocellus TaxID=1515 RepID=A3DEA8_ACET2|nr:DUF58 domain-containing protein [Acetivibrio thermocellus]CDG35750.1 hypothetical protein CTHBC1_1100 [Acetivibrio thermocellus BC1]ABN52287.1 protein of unknown function DUF58 [Acetivibrio thermocellus ATCC 27405]ADU74222.1 protein of unknown function DUF58 [Acetivibrio thermocellus DSM 1313]ALX08166.1 protein of unknown function DUF58 [Acetivibrio thermocellus AD2]ANV75913.1 protein of unknown function DUF58 [Acetivibrio thermocellus DSM 2360]
MQRNRILYSFLYVLSLIFIYFYGGKIPYMLFYTVLLLPFVSIAITSIAFVRFKYVQDIDKRSVVKGEEINYTLSIHNEDFFLYPYIKINFFNNDTIFSNQFEPQCFSLLPFKKKTFSYKLCCKYRGDFFVGVKSIEFEDYLGIVKFVHEPISIKEITVYPRLIKLDSLKLKTDYLSESHALSNSRFENTLTFSDVRKYTYGDSMKKIHWKLSSKMNELLVKNFEGSSHASSAILLDLKKSNRSFEENSIIEDMLIEASIAVIYYCLVNWIPINFIYYNSKGFNTIEAKNALEFKEIYEILSGIKFENTMDIKDVLNIYVKNSVLKKTSILLFTSNLDYGLYDEIYKTKLMGYDINLVYVCPKHVVNTASFEVNNILNELLEIGVMVYKIQTEDDIKNVLEYR